VPTDPSRLKKKQNPIMRPTLEDLLNATPSEIIDRARTQCRPIRAQYDIGSKTGWRRSYAKFPTYYNEQRVYSICTDGKRYSYIRFFGAPALTTPVWVWCSCPYFKYYLEVALSYRNGTDLKKDGGPLRRTPVRNAPPVVRNPNQALYLCKHLIVAAEIGLKQTRDMASKKYEDKYGKEGAREAMVQRVAANVRSKTPPDHAPFFDL
jgi:hypothetical protein